MAYAVAAVIVCSVLGFVAQAIGVATVRLRLIASIRPQGAPEDDIVYDQEERPWDLRAFLAVIRRLLCVSCGKATEADVERMIEIHRHATENSASVALVLLGTHLAFVHCAARGRDCSADENFAEVVAYVYLGLRMAHLLIYGCKIRQPHRALAFICTNVCLAMFLRAIISALVRSA